MSKLYNINRIEKRPIKATDLDNSADVVKKISKVQTVELSSISEVIPSTPLSLKSSSIISFKSPYSATTAISEDISIPPCEMCDNTCNEHCQCPCHGDILHGEDYCPYCDSYCNEKCECFCHDGYEEYERQNYYYIGNDHYYPDDLIRDSDNDYTNKVNEISKDEELNEYIDQPEVSKDVDKLETINEEEDKSIETNTNTVNNQENQYKIKVRPKRRKDDLKPFNPHVGHKFTPLTYEETQRKNQENIIRQRRKRKELKNKQKEFVKEIKKEKKDKPPSILQNPDLQNAKGYKIGLDLNKVKENLENEKRKEIIEKIKAKRQRKEIMEQMKDIDIIKKDPTKIESKNTKQYKFTGDEFEEKKKKLEEEEKKKKQEEDLLKYKREQYRLEVLKQQQEKEELERQKKEEEAEKQKQKEPTEKEIKYNMIREMNKGKIIEIGPGYYNPKPIQEKEPEYTISKADKEIKNPKADIPGPTDYNIKTPSPKPTTRVYRPFGCINCKGAGCELCRERDEKLKERLELRDILQSKPDLYIDEYVNEAKIEKIKKHKHKKKKHKRVHFEDERKENEPKSFNKSESKFSESKMQEEDEFKDDFLSESKRESTLFSESKISEGNKISSSSSSSSSSESESESESEEMIFKRKEPQPPRQMYDERVLTWKEKRAFYNRQKDESDQNRFYYDINYNLVEERPIVKANFQQEMISRKSVERDLGKYRERNEILKRPPEGFLEPQLHHEWDIGKNIPSPKPYNPPTPIKERIEAIKEMNKEYDGFYENQYHQEWKPPDIVYTDYDNIKGRETKEIKYKNDVKIIPFDEIIPETPKDDESIKSLSNEWLNIKGGEFGKNVPRNKAAGPFGERPEIAVEEERKLTEEPYYDVEKGQKYLDPDRGYTFPKAVEKENIDHDGDNIVLDVKDDLVKPKVPQYVNYKADKVKRINPEIEGKETEYEVKLEPNYDYGKKKQPVFSFPKHEDKPPSPEPERLILNPNYDFEKTKVPVYVNMAKQSKDKQPDPEFDENYKHAEYDIDKGLKYLEKPAPVLVNMKKDEKRWTEPKPNEEQILILNPQKVETKPKALIDMGKAPPRWKDPIPGEEKEGDVLDLEVKTGVTSEYKRPVTLVDMSKQLGRMSLNELRQYSEELILNIESAQDAVKTRVVTAPPLNKQISRDAPVIGEKKTTDTSNVDFTDVEAAKVKAGHKEFIHEKPKPLPSVETLLKEEKEPVKRNRRRNKRK